MGEERVLHSSILPSFRAATAHHPPLEIRYETSAGWLGQGQGHGFQGHLVVWDPSVTRSRFPPGLPEALSLLPATEKQALLRLLQDHSESEDLRSLLQSPAHVDGFEHRGNP